MEKAPKSLLIPKLYGLLRSHVYDLLDRRDNWDSLIVNRRKPFTYRVHTKIGGARICLHKFDPCHDHESFPHPHPWPGAFLVLKGSYQMWLGRSKDRQDIDPVTISTTIMSAGSAYEITDPLVWHAVIPLETTWTIMLNESAWAKDVAHESVRTTAGKDLDKMSDTDLDKHLMQFRALLEDYV